MTTLTAESATAMWVSIAVFSGIGIGMLYPTLSSFALDLNSQRHGDRAITNLVLFQTLGQTLGVTFASAIFQNQLYKQLLRKQIIERFARRYANDAFQLATILRDRSGNEEALKAKVADAYVEAIRVIWIVMAALAGVAMISCFFLRSPKRKGGGEVELRRFEGLAS
jgi:MFS family permease